MFLEKVVDGEKSALIAYRTPGLQLKMSLDNPVRGWYTVGNLFYVVAGDKLFEVTASYVATVVGTLLTTEGEIGIFSNGLELLIVDGANGYTYNFGTATFAQIADVDFLGGNTCTFLNSFFIVNTPSAGTFQISASYDGTAWDAAEVATAESNPDDLVAVFADHGELLLLGDLVTEIWVGADSVDFPFQRAGSAIEWGLAARWSVTKFDNSVIWLAKNKMGEVQIIRLDGYTPVRISTHDLENIINGYTNLANAKAFSYMYNGHPFYQINFDDGSWLYDGSTGVWSQVQGYGIDRHRADKALVFGNVTLLADFENGNIYSPGGYDDNGTPIVSELTSQHVSIGNERMAFSKLWVDCETGVGNIAVDNPQIALTVFKDRGNVPLSNRYASLGKVGEYKTRPIFTRLGQARDWVFRLTCSDPVKLVIMGVYLE
jgi:hypothetical protein